MHAILSDLPPACVRQAVLLDPINSRVPVASAQVGIVPPECDVEIFQTSIFEKLLLDQRIQFGDRY